jgi:predicted nucleic acid-binding protein
LADSSRKFAGGWSEADAAEFMQSIKSCEQIDNGIWIAAQTAEHGAELITADHHFEKIPGLVYTRIEL